MSLDPDHPLLPIIKRLSVWIDTNPPPADKPAQDQYRHLLVELERGDLFDRMPDIVREAIMARGGALSTTLDPIFVEIAFEIDCGLEPSAFLIQSFRLRLNPDARDGNVIPFDPPPP